MIFNLFKSRPTLSELIPKGFVDIHSHILPGIDDGAKNVEESIELISEMKKLGFSKIIGTPHTYSGLYENTNESIKESFKSLNNKLKDEINIDYASEYMIETNLFQLIDNKKLLCLKGNHILIEMSYLNKPNILYEIIFRLKVNNYIPVLAHPERYRFLHENLSEYKKLKKFGCKFQINLLSLVGYYGRDLLKICDYLISNNYVDYFASDLHNMKQILEFNKKIQINIDNAKIEGIMKNTNDIFN